MTVPVIADQVRVSPPTADDAVPGGRTHSLFVPELPRLAGPAQVRGAYWGTLSLLARADWEAAKQSLIDLERGSLQHLANDPLVELAQAELTVVERLAELDPEGLPAIAALHAAVYEAHWQHGRTSLATHAWKMTADIAEVYARRATDEAARATAARLIAVLARQLVEGMNIAPASPLLDRALALDAASEPALLLTGALYEKLGQYDKAVAMLARLVRHHPSNREGWLRQAACLRRLGRAEEARRSLAPCLEETSEEWIRTVAYDELARLAIEAGQWRQAATVLERATRVLPQSQGALLQLAYVYDRLQQPALAAAALQRLHAVPHAGPRFRYSRWPSLTASPAQPTEIGASRTQLGALSRAIARTMAPEGS